MAQAKEPLGLAAFYNAMMAPRGFQLAPHHYPIVAGLEDDRIENFLYLGPPGCLAGDTVLDVRLHGKNSGKPITIAKAYRKFNGLPVYYKTHRVDRDKPEMRRERPWSRIAPKYLMAHKGDRIGYQRIAGIIRSGVKTTYEVVADNGKRLRATAEHPFKVPDGTPGADEEGFKRLSDLRVGDEVVVRSRVKDKGGRKPNRERRTVYGLLYHPLAWKKIVAGKDYKRVHHARLVVEAAMNSLSTEEFIRIVRTDAEKAQDLRYLAPGLEVHHRDEDPLNDALDNLVVLTAEQHLALHAYEKQKNFGDVLPTTARIVSITKFGDEMTYDVVMEAPRHNYAAQDFIVHNTGKSVLLCSVYPTWRLGIDPTLTILSVSAGEKLPQGFMAASMQIIQHDPVFKRQFPNVKPAPDLGWSIQRGLFVTGHHPSDSDASYISVGLSSKALTGLHARLHIYDDLHDRENSQTPDGRAGVKAVYYDTLLGRADPRGCRRIAAGRWWAPDDLYQEWIESGDWVVLQLPATRKGEARLWYDVFVPRTEPGGPPISCVYSETLTPETLQDPDSNYVRYKAYYAAVDETRRGFYWPASPAKRREYETIHRREPRKAAINYDGDMTGGGGAVFLEADFEPFAAPCDLSLGCQAPEFDGWAKALKGEVEQAADTALGQPQSESFTCILTGLLVPCQSWHRGEDPAAVGECDFHYDVWLLWAMVGDLDFRELTLAFRTQNDMWRPRMITVEEKQSGVSLLHTFKGSHIPLRGQKVEQGKVERAVNAVTDNGAPVPGGAASVQGWARMGRIRYPRNAPWIERGPDGSRDTGFLKRVLAYQGGTRGSDEFDTLVHLVTRAIVKSRKHGRVGLANAADLEAYAAANVPGMSPVDDPRRAALATIAGLPSATGLPTPFDGLCGGCGYNHVIDNMEWCTAHGRRVSALEGCGMWRRKMVAA